MPKGVYKRGPRSPEAVEKTRIANTGKKRTEATKKLMSLRMRGLKRSEVGKRNISLAQRGRKCSEETRAKHRQFRHTEDAKRRIGFALSGSKSHLWRGGITEKQYGEEFNCELKRKIRARDNFECCLCLNERSDYKLDVHHIDYDKMNNRESNLISLCHSCHMITNGSRESWIKYFTEGIFPNIKYK